MNRVYNRLLALIFPTILLITLAGCDNSTEEERSGSSLLTPTATIDPTIYSVEGPITSGIFDRLPSADQLSLSITSYDGRYTATFPSIATYPLREPFRPGRYNVDAFFGSENDEGFDSPYFFGRSSVNMISGQTATAEIECHLANSVFGINFSDAFTGYFTNASATLHSAGGAYIGFTTDETRKAYLRPGKVALILNLTMPSGENVEFVAATVDEALEQNLYEIAIDATELTSDTPRVIVSFDKRISDDDVTFDLTPEFIASAPPVITGYGFSQDTPIKLTEGDVPTEKVGFNISGAAANTLTLTTRCQDLIALGWPAECDLATIDRATLATMESLGLHLTRSGNSISSVDLTDALSHARTTSPNPSFALTATSASGRFAGPVEMNVSLEPAEINVISTSKAVMGLNVARMKIFSRATDLPQHLDIEALTGVNPSWKKAEILTIAPDETESGIWDVTFRIPDPTSASVEIRVNYCDEEKYRGAIIFSSPDYSIDVDAFARIAVVQIEAEDPDMRDVITSMVNIYVNGSPVTLISRHPDLGKIVVGGLNSATRYEFKATLFDHQSASAEGFTKPVTVTTENTLTVPNGGFEDVKDGISYKNLPAGGRYSQNIVDIYNQQNYASYSQYIPKKWANVNAKTFCRSAKNHNTWYMQPSTYSIMNCMEGAYAVCLQTTAWDLDGPAIADYRQTSQPYTAYSRNIPTIANRAAGKLFLGEYGFDPATGREAYEEGVSFSSRPSALNGFYKFIPSIADVSDSGLIRIEIIGRMGGSEIVIASGTKELSLNTDYTTFTIPLTYNDFKIKATKLKILISSSKSSGSIETESSTIVTYSDPVTSTSLGGTLWIDDLTFAY